MSKLDGFLWCPHCGSPHTLSTRACPKTGAPLQAGTSVVRGLQPDSIVAHRYRIREKVGTEGHAGLYEATQSGSERRLLLKVVQAESGSEAERIAAVAEMEREAKVAALVESPHVAPVLDFGRLGRSDAYLVRERGRTTLAARLRVASVFRLDDAADIVTQVLSGLQVLHDEGIVHRDLGAQHVRLVERPGCYPLAKIIGLGRASTLDLGASPDGPTLIHYAAPELLRGHPGDPRSDLYSCGVLLFELLTGQRPFDGVSAHDVVRAILDASPVAPAKVRPVLEGEWSTLLARALAKDPTKRFESALAFIEALPAKARQARRATKLGEDANTLPPPTTQVSLAPADPLSRPSPLESKRDRYLGRRVANKYAIESLIGSGNAGAVYKAMHVDLRRPVAVKVLHEWNRASPQFVERFKAEALAASKLDHPNITRILDCGEEPDGTLYLVMDYVEGPSLETVLAAEGRMNQERAVTLAIQILGSLAAAHERAIIHRDVKPENIIVVRQTDRETAKVCDFGLAKLFDGSPTQELTRNGLMLGSPAYMAPEQIRGEACDERTDIYAAGVTLFELLTGRLPYEATSLADMFQRKLHEPPTRPSTYVADLDPLLEDIVVRALEADPQLRHASATELRAELIEVLEEIRAPVSSASVMHISVPPQS